MAVEAPDTAAEQPGDTHQAPGPEKGGQGSDPMKLHDSAVSAAKSLHALATGLAHANVDPKVTAQFEKMAGICTDVAKSMSRAPAPPPAAPAAPSGGGKTGESMQGAADMYARGR